MFCIQGYPWFQDERLQGKFNEICFFSLESTSTKYNGFKKEIDQTHHPLDHWLEIDTPINLEIFQTNSRWVSRRCERWQCTDTLHKFSTLPECTHEAVISDLREPVEYTHKNIFIRYGEVRRLHIQLLSDVRVRVRVISLTQLTKNNSTNCYIVTNCLFLFLCLTLKG